MKEKKDKHAGIINHEKLAGIILEIESIVDKNNLDMVEKKLLYDLILGRYNNEINKTKMNDMVGNVSLGGLFKKVMKIQKGETDGMDN